MWYKVLDYVIVPSLCFYMSNIFGSHFEQGLDFGCLFTFDNFYVTDHIKFYTTKINDLCHAREIVGFIF